MTRGVPLRNVRIADLTTLTAGAGATQMLADLGADVIKVEAPHHPDPFRSWTVAGGPGRIEAGSPPFNVVNRGKRDLVLDVRHPQGHAAFLRLVAASDVVIENFRSGVMTSLGLEFATLCLARPDVVMVSLSSQGVGGPETSFRSYGSTIDALSGLMSVTGYGPDRPVWSGNDVNYPDQVAALLGASLVLMGLRRRNRTGRPVLIEGSQRELVTTLLGEAVLDYTVNGRVRSPMGNRDSSMLPHGCFRCAGEDSWVVVTVETDEQWRALARVIGGEALATDSRFATWTARWERPEEVNALVSAWAAPRDKDTAMRILQAAGIPAGAVLNGRDLLADPNLNRQPFYRSVVHPVAGVQRQRSWPFQLEQTPSEIRGPAPYFGQHSREVLRELGYPDADIDSLIEMGAVVAHEDLAGMAAGAPVAVAASRNAGS